MRKIEAKDICQAVRDLCIDANCVLPEDIRCKIKDAKTEEISNTAKEILCDLEENFICAEEKRLPICQDTGMAVVFCEIGQEAQIVGGYLEDAVNEGVRRGYEEGFLRKSVVGDPLRRENTGDNTPAIIHVRIVKGDKIRLTVAPKGFGSENMGAMKLFNPSATVDDIEKFVLDTVDKAGAKPCPPIILGIGIGGTMEYAAYMAKYALTRDIGKQNSDPFYARLEKRLLKKINESNIGPMGMGGKTTALAVMIEHYPTHIAGMPCAINFGCHATRHAVKEL